MSDFRFFKSHRAWEDWFGMLIGVLIVVSPWFPVQAQETVDAERSVMILNTFVVGMLVFGLAQLEYVARSGMRPLAASSFFSGRCSFGRTGI